MTTAEKIKNAILKIKDENPSIFEMPIEQSRPILNLYTGKTGFHFLITNKNAKHITGWSSRIKVVA